MLVMQLRKKKKKNQLHPLLFLNEGGCSARRCKSAECINKSLRGWREGDGMHLDGADVASYEPS